MLTKRRWLALSTLVLGLALGYGAAAFHFDALRRTTAAQNPKSQIPNPKLNESRGTSK
jgi:hypothetical protein